MQSAMDQARNWVWESNNNYSNRRIFIDSSSFDSSEEFAFAKDFAGDQWGCIWPPRFYSCNFCWREFRSAQALGGHMNVHRRDRARLKLEASSSSNDEENSNPNPNPNPNPNSVAAASYSLQTQEKCSKNNLVSFDLKLGGMDCCKRKREVVGVDDVLSSHKKKMKSDDDLALGLSRKSDREDELQFLKSDEVIKFRECQVEELDLELRLGDPPKVKQDCCVIMIE